MTQKGLKPQGAQDTEDDDDDSNSVKSDSQEDEPSASTSSSKPQPAKQMKHPNHPREWKEYNNWARPKHTDMKIMAFIQIYWAAVAVLNKKAGITSLPPRHQDGKKLHQLFQVFFAWGRVVQDGGWVAALAGGLVWAGLERSHSRERSHKPAQGCMWLLSKERNPIGVE